MTNRRAPWSGLIIGVAVAGLPQAALAYVGPGVGLTAIGTFFAFVAVMFLAIVGFLWYPIRRLLRGGGPKASAQSSTKDATEAMPGDREPPQ